MEQHDSEIISQRRLPNWLITVTPLSRILAMILFILLPVVGFYLGTIYQRGIYNTKQLPTQAAQQYSNSQQKLACSQYGLSEKSAYLKKYTVKPGDTLLSIAKSELGNPSRVNELINLNKDAYPSLSISTPFIEKDWVLYLPDKSWPPSSGDIAEIKGEVTEIQADGRWALKGPQFATDLHPLSTTIMPAKKVKVGDCISAIREKGAEGNLIYVSFTQ